MSQDSIPVLYTFRRCPYAMRARMALASADIVVEHREILLKNKPPSMLKASPKGTVPVLVLADGSVIDESWDMMLWALKLSDPDQLLGPAQSFLPKTEQLVHQCEAEFKPLLDRYKYADRHPEPAESYRDRGLEFISALESKLSSHNYLLSTQLSIADLAIMPFVRQFAHVDRPWFHGTEYRHCIKWLNHLIDSPLFSHIMKKYPLWEFSAQSA